MTLTPPARWLDKLFVRIIHVVGPSSSSSFPMNLATKSTKAWALITALGRYSMSNSLSSIAHKTIRPATSVLFIALRNSLSVWTTMVCAWKYDLGFSGSRD